jgi:hypothetical protein
LMGQNNPANAKPVAKNPKGGIAIGDIM